MPGMPGSMFPRSRSRNELRQCRRESLAAGIRTAVGNSVLPENAVRRRSARAARGATNFIGRSHAAHYIRSQSVKLRAMFGRLLPKEGRFFDLFNAHGEQVVRAGRALK